MSKKKVDRPKRHCMVVHAYYPVGETRVQREALALVNHGYEVDVICLQGDGDLPVEEEDGVNINRLPIKRHKGRGLLLQLLEYLIFLLMASGKIVQLHIKKDYGTVQVHNLPDFLVFSALFPKLTGARVILDLHDLMPEFFAAKSGSNLSSWKVRLVILQEQLSCRFADHVITVTDVWKETLIERGVPAHKVSVVMNVADDRVFHRNGENRKTERDRDLFELIYHGTFTHRYGVDLIIDAVNKLRNKIPDIHLTLLGDGETLDALVELTYQLDIKDHVVFSPTLHVSELPKYIQQADVGIVPNRSNIFTDGILPTKMMEYIAMGTPVIAARTPTIETYFDDSMVLFFKPGDVDDLSSCILSLYKDRQMLMQFPQNADKFNQQYNWDKVAAGYLAQVDRLFMTNGGFKNEGKSRLAKTNPNSSGLGRNKN